MGAPETAVSTLIELLAVLGILLLADRWLHRHLQGMIFLLTGDTEIALWIYAIILFPGVVLHECSHALTAALLGVRSGKISLFPRRVGKHIQLGFVLVQETDFLRASLIGAAPLLIGGTIVAIIGTNLFGTPEVMTALATGQWGHALQGLFKTLQLPDLWIWAYLVFAISNTMLPSKSDIHAWPLLGGILAALFILILSLGGGAWILSWAVPSLTAAARWIILLGISTALVDLPFFSVIFLLEKAIGRLRGREVVYKP
jgi:hypothetical protein